MAQDAGTTAGISGVLLALITGQIGKRFEVNPFATGAKGKGIGLAASAGSVNIGKEGVEETVQEMPNQFSSNLGLNAVNIETELDRGVGHAGGEGLVGGISAAGAVQAPGVVLHTTRDLLLAGADGASKAVTARQAAQERKAGAASPVGSAAQADAAQIARDTAEALRGLNERLARTAEEHDVTDPVHDTGQNDILGVLPSAVLTPDTEPAVESTGESQTDPIPNTPNQTTPHPTTPSEVVTEAASKSVFVEPEEAAALATHYPAVAAAQERLGAGAKLDRPTVINAVGETLKDRDAPAEEKIGAALTILSAFEETKQIDNTEVEENLLELAVSDPIREGPALQTVQTSS